MSEILAQGEVVEYASQGWHSDEMQDVGLPIIYGPTDSSVGPSAFVNKVTVGGEYRTGIRLEHAWNATVQDTFVYGHLGDEKEYANPQHMQVGIDLVGAMDCNVVRPRITSAGIGIRANTHPSGAPRCEGLEVSGGYLMHVNTGIELNGSMAGGWPTPSVDLHPRHVAFNQFGIYATNVSWLDIHHCNLYCLHYSSVGWAIKLVGCKQVTISDIDVWTNRGDTYLVGIVLEGCEDVEINGGNFVGSIKTALYASPTCKNVRTNGKVWDMLKAQGKVDNRAA